MTREPYARADRQAAQPMQRHSIPVKRAVKQSNTYALMGFWVVLLLFVGAGQRWMRRSLNSVATRPITLERPLSTLPLRIGTWDGVEVPLDARVAERAANDDYVNRRYVDTQSNRFVDFFVAYTASPVTMLGHRPDQCYPAVGWQLVESRPDTVTLPDGKRLDCLIHDFTRGGTHSEGLVVLNYYVLQGKYTTKWTDFWGPSWRSENLSGDPSFYVAQVQIVCPVMVASLFERGEETVKRFSEQIVDEVERLLPMTPLASHSETASTRPTQGDAAP